MDAFRNWIFYWVLYDGRVRKLNFFYWVLYDGRVRKLIFFIECCMMGAFGNWIFIERCTMDAFGNWIFIVLYDGRVRKLNFYWVLYDGRVRKLNFLLSVVWWTRSETNYATYWADHSSRGVLPTVVRRYVWSRNLVNEEAITRVGPRRQKK